MGILDILFFGIIIVLFIMFLKREQISEYFRIETKDFLMYLGIVFVIVLALGMLLDNTKSKYSGISSGYQNMHSQDSDKPHRWFDIDFDKLFPK